MPKQEWGSPEHRVDCHECNQQMQWESTSIEDTLVCGYVAQHMCMKCGYSKWILLDNNRNQVAVYDGLYWHTTPDMWRVIHPAQREGL